MHKADMESLADRIARMRFAVVLLAEVMEIQGLATRAEIRHVLATAATMPTRAATVAKALSAISQKVEELEERATKEWWPALQVVRPDTPVGH
jgi:CO/xanthine dehydrogenase FAD-binding subunit